KARRVVARIYNLPKRDVAAQEIVDLPPGQTQRVMLNMRVPDAGQVDKLFLVRDSLGDKAILNVQQTVTVLEPMNLTLWRERYWYGDKTIDGRLTLGAADVRDLNIELWSVTHRVAQHT